MPRRKYRWNRIKNKWCRMVYNIADSDTWLIEQLYSRHCWQGTFYIKYINTHMYLKSCILMLKPFFLWKRIRIGEHILKHSCIDICIFMCISENNFCIDICIHKYNRMRIYTLNMYNYVQIRVLSCTYPRIHICMYVYHIYTFVSINRHTCTNIYLEYHIIISIAQCIHISTLTSI